MPTPAPEGSESKLERRVKFVTSILAPTTVLVALLFYYGYVTTAAEYGWFGISMGSLKLSYQDLLLNSVGVLYVPLGALLVLAGLWAHLWLHRTGRNRWSPRTLRAVALLVLGVGGLAFLRGVLGVAAPSITRTEWIALSPICLGLGISALVYGLHLLTPAGDGAWSPCAASPYSAYSGRPTASRPRTAVDGRQRWPSDWRIGRPSCWTLPNRLFVKYPGVVESTIPSGEEQPLRYRYRGFRLLVEANGRLFLLPDQWQREGGATLVLPADGGVRLQFYRTG